MADADVVVVGGGPAGAAAARCLAPTGASVIVLEAATFPRDKVCGGFVSPVALLELQRMGLDAAEEIRGANPIRRAALHLDGRKLVAQPFPRVRGLADDGRCLPRWALDRCILEGARRAGARVEEGWRAIAIERDADGITVHAEGPAGRRRVRGRLLVGADGSNSLVARQLLARRPASRDRIVAVRAYFDGVHGDPGQADLYFTGGSFPGYAWLFPIGETSANVGVGMMVETMPPSGTALRGLLLDLIRSDEALAWRLRGATMSGRIEGWPLTTYDPGARPVGHRVMLVGDAAGLINPLNGEGIPYALASGRWAAEAAHEALSSGDVAAALDAYARRVEEALRHDMALSRLVIQLIRNRTLNPLWLHALRIVCRRARRDPEYAGIVGGILAGVVPARRAASWTVLERTLRQAAASAGVDLALTAVRGRRGIARVVRDALRGGADIASESLRHPAELAAWGADVAVGAVELASQVLKHAAASTTAGGERKPGVRWRDTRVPANGATT